VFRGVELEIRTTSADGQGRRVAVEGELDIATAEQFEKAVRDALAQGPVRLDLAGLTFMDSAGIRVVDAILRALDERGWRLAISPVLHPAVRATLELTGMIAVLPFADEPEELP
jgi:anti-sigma B factor antagonist